MNSMMNNVKNSKHIFLLKVNRPYQLLPLESTTGIGHDLYDCLTKMYINFINITSSIRSKKKKDKNEICIDAANL